jgi:hypothetical protein
MIKDIVSQLVQQKNALQAQIDKIDQALNSLSSVQGGGGSGVPSPFIKTTKTGKKKGGMSAAGRAAIIAAQKARWARVHAAQGKAPAAVKPAKKKVKISAAGIARIKAAQKKRWAAYNKAKAAAKTF